MQVSGWIAFGGALAAGGVIWIILRQVGRGARRAKKNDAGGSGAEGVFPSMVGGGGRDGSRNDASDNDGGGADGGDGGGGGGGD
jgi:hypothetical protein